MQPQKQPLRPSPFRVQWCTIRGCIGAKKENRRFVDKRHKKATTPISSLCCIPRTASLPNAPWSGRDLAVQIEAKRSTREMNLAGILAPTSLVPARRPCIHTPSPGSSSGSLLTHLASDARWDAAVRLCGLRLVFIVWGHEEGKGPRFPSTGKKRNSSF